MYPSPLRGYILGTALEWRASLRFYVSTQTLTKNEK